MVLKMLNFTENNNRPLITILLPSYNCSKYIEEAIKSCLEQSYSNFELLVIDDGSTDKTSNIVMKLVEADKRISYFKKNHSGITKTLNLGLKLANGKYIAVHNADDFMTYDRLETQLNFALQNPQYSLLGSFIYYVDENGKPIGASSSPYTNEQKIYEVFNNKELVGFSHASFFYRKNDILKIGGYDENLLLGEDIDLINRFLKAGLKVKLLDIPLVYARIRSDSTTVKNLTEIKIINRWIKNKIFSDHDENAAEDYARFKESFKKLTFTKKLIIKLKDLGFVFYKLSTIEFSRKSYLKAATNYLIALLLYPKYAIGKLYFYVKGTYVKTTALKTANKQS